MVPGEAVVALVLKPLSRAQSDGDRIVGVIRASGVNYDGKTNGLTVPSAVAQQGLLESVYARAGIDVEPVGYVIAHGTATRLGDPVEVSALCEVLPRARRSASTARWAPSSHRSAIPLPPRDW